MALLILPIGFVFDALLEIFLVRTGLYIYSQVIPLGSVFAGKPYQFPLIWESALVTVVMIPAGVLCYRDDTGQTQAEKLAAAGALFASRPALGTFLVMFVIINLAYFATAPGSRSSSGRGPRRRSRARGRTRRPKSTTRRASTRRPANPGPYSVGIWSTWMSAQPDGRPDVEAARRERSVCTGERRMAEPRSVVITGASRGLGFASAPHLHQGAGGRRRDAVGRRGLERLREATGRGSDDPRLIGVQLDLTDPASVAAAAKSIEEAVGAPYGLVHNAGISAAGWSRRCR